MAVPEWNCYAVIRGKQGLSNCIFVSWEDARPHVDEEDGYVRGLDFEAFPDLVSAHMWLELCSELEGGHAEKEKEVEVEVDVGDDEERGEEPPDDEEEEEEQVVEKRKRRKKGESVPAKTKDAAADDQGGRSKATSKSGNVAEGGEEGSEPHKKRKRGVKGAKDKVVSKGGSSKKTASATAALESPKSNKSRKRPKTAKPKKKASDSADIPSGMGDTEAEEGSSAKRWESTEIEEEVEDEVDMTDEGGEEEPTDDGEKEKEPVVEKRRRRKKGEHNSAKTKYGESLTVKTKKGNTEEDAQGGRSKATSESSSNVAGGGKEGSEPQKKSNRGEKEAKGKIASKGGRSKKTASAAAAAALESPKSKSGKRTNTANPKKEASDASDTASGIEDTEAEGGSPAQRAKSRSRLSYAVSQLERKHFSWEERIAQLKDYQKEHGHCNVHRSHPILGEFVREQRASYGKYIEEKASSLTAERVKELTDLGLKLQKGEKRSETSSTGGEDSRVSESPRREKDPPNPERLRKNYPARRLSYEDRIEQLQRYKEMYGDLLVGAQFADLPGLGSWVKNARKEYKKFSDGKESTVLNSERVKQLEEMGFVFQPKRGRQYSKGAEVDDHNSD